MFVNSKDLNILSNNLCLPKERLSKLLNCCKTVGDIASIDLGLDNEKLEKRVKQSLIVALYKLNLKRERK